MQERFFQERRKAPRVLVDFPLEFVHPFPREVIRVKDISLSGICCFSGFHLPEMTRVGIILKLPLSTKGGEASDNIKCEGAVVRCETKHSPAEDPIYELAIFFTEISPESRNILQQFIDSRLVKKSN